MFRGDVATSNGESPSEHRFSCEFSSSGAVRSSFTSIQLARLIVVVPSVSEFETELRFLLCNVISDVQQYASQLGVDVEFILPIKEKLGTTEAAAIVDLLRQPASYLIFLLGDRYGEVMPPLEMKLEEFNALRKAALSSRRDIEILEYYYGFDESRDPPEYRLRCSDFDAAQESDIRDVIVRSANAAFGNKSSSNNVAVRQNLFFSSGIDNIAQYALRFSERAIFILRELHGEANNEANDIGMKNDGDERVRLESLKKLVIERASKPMIFSIQLDSVTTDSWIQSKAHEKYIASFTHQITERLHQLIASISQPLPRVVHPKTIAINENSAHSNFAISQLPSEWLARNAIDDAISRWIEEKYNEQKYIQIHGKPASGKTAILCRLYSLLCARKCYVIIRFVGLIASSNMAHELWYGICLTLCLMSGQNTEQILCSSHLSTSLSIFKSVMKKLDRPLFLLIDDSNLIKYGRILSALEKPFRKLMPNLVLICTSALMSKIPFLPDPQYFALPDFTESEVIEILKSVACDKMRRLTDEHMKVIKRQMRPQSSNPVVARLLLDELLDKGVRPMEEGLDDRFARIEFDIGTTVVRELAQLITVSSHGLTTLEIIDALSANKELLAATENAAFSPLLLYSAIKQFGTLLMSFMDGNRLVYRWSHHFIASVARRRYFTDTVDWKQTHSELADLFADLLSGDSGGSPRFAAGSIIFPQPLRRDNGSANVRRVCNLWYHLLHTGNMETLKEIALCQFDYVDACVRSCGIAHLLSIYEECSMQVLHHDIQVLCEQVLLPSLSTVIRDNDQLAAELIGRLRYTRAQNSHFLNAMVEQAMAWVDMYSNKPLLVPLTCWISPPKMKQVLSFNLTEWKSSRTILQPTFNHQHLLITGDEANAGLVYLYHIASQLLIRTFNGHKNQITSISISTNGDFFVTTSVDGSVRIWIFSQVEARNVLTPHNGKVMCSVVSRDCNYVITGGTDSCANVIDVNSGSVVRSFKDHTGTVISLAITSNDDFLVTGSGDFVVMVWDLKNGNLAVRMAGLMAPVSCMTLTSNDAFVIVACEDETVRVFSTVSGQELHELSGHEGKIATIVAAYDDCQLFAATVSKIYAYDLHNGKLLDILDCNTGKLVTSLKITSDNCFLLSACGDRIDVWNIFHQMHHCEPSNGINDEKGDVTGICLSADEKSAACATRNGVVAMWDLEICQCIWAMVQKKSVCIECIQFSSDSLYVLSGDAEGQINIWESATGRLFRKTNNHAAAIRSISCLSDDVRVLSSDASNIVFIWNMFVVDDGLEMDRPITFAGMKSPVSVCLGGTHIIGFCSDNNREMSIWLLEDDMMTMVSKISHNEEILCNNVVPHGSLLVTGSADQSLRIWQIETGTLVQILVGHEGAVVCCQLAETEDLVVSGAKDGQIIVWNVSTGDAATSIHTSAPMNAISITADASVIFSADESSWVEAWDTCQGTLLSSFNTHGSTRTLISSVDGNRILLLLENCAQLPILCLHNTPALVVIDRPATEQSQIQFRTESVTSICSGSEGRQSPEIETSLQTANFAASFSSVCKVNGDVNSLHPSSIKKPSPRPHETRDRSRLKTPVEGERATISVAPNPLNPPQKLPKSHLCSVH